MVYLSWPSMAVPKTVDIPSAFLCFHTVNGCMSRTIRCISRETDLHEASRHIEFENISHGACRALASARRREPENEFNSGSATLCFFFVFRYQFCAPFFLSKFQWLYYFVREQPLRTIIPCQTTCQQFFERLPKVVPLPAELPPTNTSIYSNCWRRSNQALAIKIPWLYYHVCSHGDAQTDIRA